MKVFGPLWVDYHNKIKTQWEKTVGPDDLVLIPGDISWAMRLEEAMEDLAFIDALPGTKVLIRGNHDYWWPSLKKLEALPFASLKYIHNTTYVQGRIAICGSRLWDTPEFSFREWITFRDNPKAKEKEPVDHEKIFLTELERLKRSIDLLPEGDFIRIAMVHYPPIGKDLKQTRASILFEENRIKHVCFGHLHNLNQSMIPYGSVRGVTYHFCAADHVDFTPQKMLSV